MLVYFLSSIIGTLSREIHIAHITLLRTYTLHTCHYCAHTYWTHAIIAHMIPHGLTTFHAKRDSNYVFIVFFDGAPVRGHSKYCIHAYILQH